MVLIGLIPRSARGVNCNRSRIGLPNFSKCLGSRSFLTANTTAQLRPSCPTALLTRPQNPVSSSPSRSVFVRFNSTSSAASATATGSVSSISLPPTTLQPIDSVTSSSGGLLAEISSKETSYVHHIGNLKELGLDFGWGPTAIVEFILEHIHVWAGTPWLASMSLTAIALRLSLAYLHAKSIDASARATALSPITKKIQEKMKEGQRVGDQAIVMEAKGELQGVFKTAGIKKRHLFAFTLIQLPLGYGTFRLLRSMADKRVPGLEDGGILWFQDLTIMDPYLILPLLSGALTYIIIKKNSMMGNTNMTPTMMKLSLYGLPTMTTLFSSYLPACLQFSFLLTSILAYLQTLFFGNPSVRRLLKIAPIPPRATPPGTNPLVTPLSKLRIAPSLQASSERSLGLPFPPEKPKGIIGGAISEIKGMIAEGKRTANKISGTSAATGKKSASDLKRATAFEKKRKSELDQLRWDNEAHSRRKWHEKKGAQAHKTRDSSRA